MLNVTQGAKSFSQTQQKITIFNQTIFKHQSNINQTSIKPCDNPIIQFSIHGKLCLFLQKQDFSSLFIHSIYPLKYIHTIPSTSHRFPINFLSTSHRLLIDFPSPSHIKTSPVEIMGSESASLAPAPLCLPISTPLSSNSNSRVPPSHSPSVLPFNLTSFKLLSRFRNNVSQVI